MLIAEWYAQTTKNSDWRTLWGCACPNEAGTYRNLQRHDCRILPADDRILGKLLLSVFWFHRNNKETKNRLWEFRAFRSCSGLKTDIEEPIWVKTHFEFIHPHGNCLLESGGRECYDLYLQSKCSLTESRLFRHMERRVHRLSFME